MDVFNSFLPISSEHLPLFMHGAVKVLLVLVVTAALAFCLRHRGAALRHWIWSLGLSGTLLIPVLMVVMPAWDVPLPVVPEPGAQAEVTATEASTDTMPQALPATPLIPHAESKALADRAQAAPPTPVIPRSDSPIASADEVATAASPLGGLTWQHGVLMLWLAGAFLVALYFVAGSLYARQLIRRGQTVTDPKWKALFEDVSLQLSLQRTVGLIWSDRAAMPFTWGIFRPVIVLPTAAREWTVERRRIVLLHEGAHIKRWDCLTQAIGQLACTLHWFNPLSWWASRRLRVERERATDDYVLKTGTRPSTYAEHLLEMARSLSTAPGTPFGAVSMAKPSQLEGRLLSILNPNARRLTLSQVGRYLTSGAFLLLILPLAAMQPASPGSTAPEALADNPVAVEEPLADAPAEEASSVASSVSSDQDPIRQTFHVEEGGLLNLDTERGNITVETRVQDEVTVEVHIDERERTGWFEVDFEQRDADVHVRGNVVESGFLNWLRNRGGASVRFVVTVPHRYNLDLNTSGGSMDVGDIEGTVAVRTSGGNIHLGQIDGPVEVQTSGGSIHLASASQDAQVRTSGGSIRLGPVQGSVEARTSGGSILVEGVAGSVNARTSGGSITAHLTEQPHGDSELRTSGGNITAFIAEGIGLDLHAGTSAGRVTTDLPVEVQGELTRTELRGTIAGGGPALTLRTSAGNVRIRSAEATAESEPEEWSFRHEGPMYFDEDWPGWSDEDVRALEESIEALVENVGRSVEHVVASIDVQPMVDHAHEQTIGALIEAIRGLEDPFSDERITRGLSESLADMLEEQAYRNPTLTITRPDGEREEVSVVELLAELPAEISNPALARLTENHPDPEVREKASAARNPSR